VFWSLMLLEL